MIKTIQKRSGEVVAFSPDTANHWAEWAARKGVDWSGIILGAARKVFDGCTTDQWHDALISECVDKETIKHLKMANRLYIGKVYKNTFGDWRDIPSVKDMYYSMVSKGLWAEMDYTDAELDQCQKFIDHSRDLEATLTETKQVMDKYAIRDRIDGKFYETPQFMYMRMALGNMEKMPKDRRMEDVYKIYTYWSEKKINPPSPFQINLGTPKKQYASCCTFTTKDTIPSLAAADHIAYVMTAASAGIGSHITSRSKGDKVRQGAIIHQGKLPYYVMQEKAVAANKQGSRGGANTMHFNCLDPELADLMKLKNVQSVEAKKIKDIDYSFGYNPYLAHKAAKRKQWMLVSYAHAPKLHELFYSDNLKGFIDEYERVAADQSIPKQFVDAWEAVVLVFLTETVGHGRLYEHNVYEMNRHTPFKEVIHSSNLCVAPETLILTDKGHVEIQTLKDSVVNVWNGSEFSEVVVRQTSDNSELVKVSFYDGSSIDCTPYHKFYVTTFPGSDINELMEVEAQELRIWDEVIKITSPGKWEYVRVDAVEDNNRYDKTFCFTEPKRHMGVFNGILTGQCQEIGLPTSGYDRVDQLYQQEDIKSEIGLCSLSAIAAGLVSFKEYEDVAYYAALSIDNVIDIMEYPFPQLEYTAKRRRSIGVGITNLAYAMAKEKMKYSSLEGKQYIHRLSELHSYSLHKAAVRLARERGACEWLHKTKYNEGWLPIDTCNKKIRNIIGQELLCDWEGLRSELLEYGSRFSVLEAHMPRNWATTQ